VAFDVKSVWSGALTATSVRVVADTAPPTNGSLLVADNEAMTGAVTIGPVTATAQGILAFTVTGLDPDTQYWYVVDAGGLNNSYKGTFRTHPGPIGEPASYIFGAAGDAGLVGAGDDSWITNGVSNNPVFDTMRAQCGAEGWAWFSHLGDLHYRNHNVNDPDLFRTAYDDNHNFNLGFNPAARQGMFLRGQAITYIWDDHDFGGNDSNRTVASNPAANQVYRECVPHYPLPGGSTGIYQSWQVGRVLYVATDSRSFRDPNADPQGPSKTLLGTGQKAWLENLLGVARDQGAEALVWQSSSRWIGGSDTWSSFENERAEMVQMFGDLGWLDRMIFMTADEHALSICSGPYNPYGHFPMFMFASMDSNYGGNSTEIYDLGQSAGRQRYGTMRVADNGHSIALTGTGYVNGSVWQAYTKHVHVGGRVIALDYAAGHVSEPFEPTDDDQRLRNEITAQREDGGEYTYAKTEGPNNTGDPALDADAAGVYDEGVTVNVASDAQLPDQAAWRVHLGTTDEDRYPLLRVDLAANPDLADDLTSIYLGDRITVANPPAWLAPEAVDLIAEGGTETIGHPNHWDLVLNASPGSPWTVAQIAAPQTLASADAETNLTSWTGANAALSRVALPAPAPFPGSWAALVTPNGGTTTASANAPATAVGSIIPGEQYIVSCWVYSPGGWADMKAAVDWQDAAGTYLSTSGTGSVTAVPAGQWTLLAQTLTAPANASRAIVRSLAGSSPGAGNTWYTTRLTVREAKATGASAGPNRPNRLDTSASHLVSAVAAADTDLVVHTVQNGIFDRAQWINSAGLTGVRPTQFPFDLKVGGEVVRATAIKPLAYDTFTRTVAAGSWGTSDGGQAWSLVGGTNSERSVDGSRGLVVLPSAPSTLRVQVLPTVVGDCDIRVRLSVDQVATGASFVPGILMRYLDINNFYRARLHLSTGGSMFVSITRGTTQLGTEKQLPHTYTAGAEFELRVRLVGHRILARAWPAGQTEPAIWHTEQTVTSSTIEAGQVGLSASAFSGNTNVSPTCRYDAFEVLTPQRFTVQRGINTIAKAQAAGTAISLAQPAHVAL
jgi:hypothetical protein